VGGACGASRAADLVFGDFEAGLDPFLEVVQFNGGPNAFNGSTTNNVTHGSMSGNFTTATGWQQYLRFNSPAIDPGTVAGELPNYNALAVDITVPAGTVPDGFFVHEMVINASGFGFLQSGNLTPVQGAPDDLKGREKVTLLWNYRTLPTFDAAYAAFLATTTDRYFQALLVSNHGNGWDGPSFDLDNWRLTNPVVPNAAWNVDSNGAWSQGGNWNPTTPPNNPGAVATFGPVINAPRTVNVDAPQTVGSIVFNSANTYTIGGASTLTLAIDTGHVAIRVDAGSHAIVAPLVLNRDLTVTVAPGDGVLRLNGPITSTGRTITKAGAGRLDVSRVNAAGLNVNAGTVGLNPNGTAAGTSRVNTLNIAGGATPTAKLDLTNNAFVVDYTGASTLDTLKVQVTTAYNGGAWDGNGITSSNANASNFAVGYGEASALATVPAIFGTVDSTAALLRFTRYGDANLDGQVNLQDFNRLASNFGITGAVWTQGDFNYDGNVNLQDFNRLASNFGLSAAGPEVTPADWTALGAAIPEPATVWAAAGTAVVASARRRRRSGH
jgi:hypothetical protein